MGGQGDRARWERLKRRWEVGKQSPSGSVRRVPVSVEDGASPPESPFKRNRVGLASAATNSRSSSVEGSELDEEMGSLRLRSDEGWVRSKKVDALPMDASELDSTNGDPDSQPGTPDAASTGGQQISAAEMAERRKLMFDPAAGEPKASGRQPKVSTVTKGLMKIAWEEMDELPKLAKGRAGGHFCPPAPFPPSNPTLVPSHAR